MVGRWSWPLMAPVDFAPEKLCLGRLDFLEIWLHGFLVGS